MTYETINDSLTIAGNGEGTLLANRYRIVKQLGQGGMGSVWLAEDTQLDNKQFAIKMLPSILVSNKRAYRQLKDEALVAMQLVHPNIVQIRAFEENNGNPFLVMDYVDGQTLDDYLAEHTGTTGVPTVAGSDKSVASPNSTPHRGSGTLAASPLASGGLPEADVLRILRPIAAALDYAHAKGVVHRDVKPANVMIAKDGTPYILDFGIAREIQETMTRVTGKLSSGTLLYMSPEQLRGETPKPTQDVYSFAAMAYECLRGDPPFSRGQIEFQILNEPPPPLPDGVSIGSSVMSGLAKRPENRPKNCAAVLYVPQAQVGVARALRPSSPKIGITAAPQKRNAPGVTHAMVFIVAILAVLGGVLWHQEAKKRETMRRRALAQRQAEEQRQPREKSAGQAEKDARKTAKVEKNAREKEEPERRKKAEESRLAAKSKAKDAANGESQEAIGAKSLESHIWAARQADEIREKAEKLQIPSDISDDAVFKVRMEELVKSKKTAEELFKNKQWCDAAKGFTNYVEGCKGLVASNALRNAAVKARTDAENEQTSAKETGAEQYATESWKEANIKFEGAQAAFEGRNFSKAKDTFASARTAFVNCAKKAREERDRQAVNAEKERTKAKNAKKKATEANAEKYVPDAWRNAVRVFNRATTNLNDKRFKDASEDFSSAVDLFEKCERDAEAERRRQEIKPCPKVEQPRKMEQPTKNYAYEARFVPYVMEHGQKKFVRVPIEHIDFGTDIHIRLEEIEGQYHVVVGSETMPKSLLRLELTYGRHSTKEWISVSLFNNLPKEVELK